MSRHKDEREATRATAAPTNSSNIVNALTTLVSGRVELKDVLSGKFDPVDLIDLAKDLNDIASELKRRAKAKSRGSASVTEGGR